MAEIAPILADMWRESGALTYCQWRK